MRIRSVGADVSPNHLRRVARVGIGFAVSSVVVALLLRAVGIDRVLDQLRRADPALVAVGIVAAAAATLLWSEAQRQALGVTVEGVGGLRFRAAFLTGDLTKQLLPMGHVSGPAIMAYAVSSVLDVEYERTLAAITVSDLLNLVASIVLAGAGVGVFAARYSAAGLGLFVGGLVVAAVGVVGVVGLVTVRRRTLTRVVLALTEICHRAAGRMTSRLDAALSPARVELRLEGYYRALDGVSADRARLGSAAAFALAGWICYAIPLYASGLALDIGVPLALAVFLVPLAGLATWFPLPGGLGGVEVALTAGLVALAGLDLGDAAAVAFLCRLCTYWFVVVLDALGALFLLIVSHGDGTS